MKRILDSGLVYVHGRDRWFRPIVICQARILTDNNFNLDDAIKLSFFVNRYGQQTLGLHGKVENWLQVTDLGGVAVTKVPLKYVYKYISLFQSNLKWRCIQFINLNWAFPVRAIWQIVHGFVDIRLRNKIIITKNNDHHKLHEMIHPSQLEEKFGGEAPNLTMFWPPKHISDNYGHDETLILPEEQISESCDVPIHTETNVNCKVQSLSSNKACKSRLSYKPLSYIGLTCILIINISILYFVKLFIWY